jgi:OmpA-OmpF porin, OOP family
MTERGVIGGGLAAFVLLCVVCVWQHPRAGSATQASNFPKEGLVKASPASNPTPTIASSAPIATPVATAAPPVASAPATALPAQKPPAVSTPVLTATPAMPPSIATPALSGAKKVEQDIARQLSGKVVEFESVSDKLTPKGKAVLDGLLPLLAQDPSTRFVIEGHTDSWGEKEFNQALSERRAQTVRAYLVSKGLDAQRFTARGYGDTKPIANNKTSAGSQKNRRIEFKAL